MYMLISSKLYMYSREGISTMNWMFFYLFNFSQSCLDFSAGVRLYYKNIIVVCFHGVGLRFVFLDFLPGLPYTCMVAKATVYVHVWCMLAKAGTTLVPIAMSHICVNTIKMGPMDSLPPTS